ncbi:hypothetical protein CHH55_20660 [Niallia circulans]|jgi:hypothetical protein|nr:hypothetical protein CHH62_21280 [Niallia circulans]PAD85950.1 hypothetical protein CHH55_20660 [Niallia circulans]
MIYRIHIIHSRKFYYGVQPAKREFTGLRRFQKYKIPISQFKCLEIGIFGYSRKAHNRYCSKAAFCLSLILHKGFIDNSV